MAVQPSLDEFLPAAREDNPGVSDQALTSYWQKTYGSVATPTTTLPTLDLWMKTAKEDNPSVPESDLKAYWQREYGAKGATEKSPTFLESVKAGAKGGALELGVSGASTIERLQEEGHDWQKWAKQTADTLSAEAEKYAPSAELANQPWYDRLRNPEYLGKLIGNVAVQSVPSLAGAVAGGMVAGPPGAAAGLIATTYFQQAGSTYREAFDRYKKDGLPDQDAHAKAYEDSGFAGLVSGVVNSLAIPASLAAPFASTLKNLVLQYGLNVAIDTADQATQNILAKATYNPEQELTAGIPEAVVGSALLSSPETMVAVKSVAGGPAKVAGMPAPAPPQPQTLPSTSPPQSDEQITAKILAAPSIDDAISASTRAIEETHEVTVEDVDRRIQEQIRIRELDQAIAAQEERLRGKEAPTGPAILEAQPAPTEPTLTVAEPTRLVSARAETVSEEDLVRERIRLEREKLQAQRIAPVQFSGVQSGFGEHPPFILWTATQDLPPTEAYPEGVPRGSTVSSDTVRKAGFQPPPLTPEGQRQLERAQLAYQRQPEAMPETRVTGEIGRETENLSPAEAQKLGGQIEAAKGEPLPPVEPLKPVPPTGQPTMAREANPLTPRAVSTEAAIPTSRAPESPVSVPPQEPSQPSPAPSMASQPTVPAPAPVAAGPTTGTPEPGTALHPAIEAYIATKPPAMQSYFREKAKGFQPDAFLSMGGQKVPVQVRQWLDKTTAMIKTPSGEVHTIREAPAKFSRLPGKPLPKYVNPEPLPQSEAIPAVTQPRHELSAEQNANLEERADIAAEMVAQGTPGKRIFTDNPTGPGQIVTGVASTYPKWYGPLKMKKETVLKALEKIRRDKGEDVGPAVEKVKSALLSDRDLDKLVGEFPGLEEELSKEEYGTPFAQIRGKNAGQTGMFGEEPTPEKPAAKPKPEQAALPMDVETEVGQRPIIGREATREEAPLFSKEAQTEEPEQTAIEEQKEPWQMTALEYTRSRVPQAMKASEHLKAQHRVELKAAIRRGETIPAEVMADYPDLKPAETSPPSPADTLATALETAAKTIREAGRPKEGLPLAQAEGQKFSQIETPAFKAWFKNSKVVDENGKPLVVYHGTKRPDRIGDRFRKSRATSGPMAFFTDDPAIASKYATGKQDTSAALEDRPYETWFKVTLPGMRTPVNLDRAWYFLPTEQRQQIAALAPRITKTDDGKQIILGDEDERRGLGGYDQHIKEARGNHLKALVEEWLNSGALFNEEETFRDVLRLAGMDVSTVTYDDPHAEIPGVYPVYLSIQNPLVTSTIPDEVVAALEDAAKRRRAKASIGADPWDKNIRDPKDWISQLKQDRAEGKNSFVWSSIPDFVTDVLKAKGYDGIHDMGGKMGGVGHDVWIPFEETQVKSATGNKGTFNPQKKSILLQPEGPALKQASPSSLLEEAAAFTPTTEKKGDHWSYTTIQGTEHPATYPTEKDALAAANKHREEALEDIKSVAFQRMLARIHGQEVTPIARESSRLTIKKALRDFDASRITEEQFIQRMEDLYSSLELKRQEKVFTEKTRLRGADIIRERMQQAVRRGDLPREQMELAEWFLKGNDKLFVNLGISVRQPTPGQSGSYDPVNRIMTLMKGTQKTDTAVHEMLHHLERLMPAEYQQAIRKEWERAIVKAMDTDSPQTKKYLEAVLDANASNKTSDWEVAHDFINNGEVPYELYNLMNASEWWAVNASGILQARHTGVWGRIAQWLREALEHIKEVLDLPSDAPILRALSWLQSESTGLERSRRMIADVRAYAQTSGPVSAPPARGIDRLGTLTEAQQNAIRHVHGTPQTWQEKLNDFKADWSRTLIQGLFDQYAPILGYSKKGYILARMAKGGEGTLEALLLYGKPYVDADGAYRVEYSEKTGPNGFGKVLANLQGEADRFLEWVAAQRAERLKGIGLEHLYRDTDIAALKTLSEGQMPDGSSRKAAYNTALLQLNEWNAAMVKIAVDSKLIDAETAKLFKDTPYVPFYRLQEEGVASGFGMKAGLVNQYAWKKLKGGTEHLNDDLLANLLQNWSHLITASAKNRAAKATLEAGVQAGVAHEVPSGMPGKGLVGFRDDVTNIIPKGQEYEEGGQTKVSDGTAKITYNAERVFMVDDPALMDAVAALHYAGLGSVGKPFITAKRWLTTAVTVNPAFKIRNLIRDSIQAIGTADLSYNPAANIVQGFKGTEKWSETRAQLLAGGGMIRFGSMLDGNNADRTRRLIEQQVDPETILDNAGKLSRFWNSKIVPAFEAYQELGDRGEQISRAALYEQLLAKGMSHQEASFWARDLLDFSLSGKWEAVRILTQVVPFMNARLQGIYKLGRATKQDYRRMGTTLGAVALSSMALLLAYQDDDDWKKREDWDRDNYWWFKVGDLAFRLPKPFEIGAIGTLAERTAEYFLSDEMTGERFGQRLSATIFSQLSMNPTPQLAKPLMDLYANKDAFTGRPIETLGMERLRKEDRLTERTSELAKFLGSLGLPDPTQLAMGHWNTLSPVQIDALVHGYFGWVGTSATVALDYGLRPMMNRGERPDLKLKDVFLAGNFVESLPTGTSRYVTQLYDQATEIEQAYGSYRDALKRGDREKAQEILAEERDKIRQYHKVEALKRQESALNAQIRRIEASRNLTGAEKRLRLDELQRRKNRVAQSLVATR